MKRGRVAVVAGATGLIGSTLTRGLLCDPSWTRVVVVTRRPSGYGGTSLDERLLVPLTPETLPSFDPGPVQTAFCCLGTTIRSAGSRVAFRRIDFELVEAFARMARRAGARHLLAVSSVGADPGARAFYSRVKGEMEARLLELDFDRLDLLRPSLLLGDREEKRPAEQWAIRLARPLAPLMVGPLARYRPIEAADVAAALRAAAERTEPGVRILEGDALRRLAKRP